MSIFKRLRGWWIRRIALPSVNRYARAQGVHLYRYVADVDRLVPVPRLSRRVLAADRSPNPESDDWYRALRERDLHVGVAFDVGVNYGYTTAWLSRWADRVVAFEPHPANAELVREQLRIRRIDNVELVPCAVSDREGQATLHVRKHDGHHSLGISGASPTREQVAVPTTTLDRAAEERGIDRVGLLKIDVEGYEPDVLEGARRLLGDQAIDLILFEYTPAFYRQRGIDPCAPIEVVERFGYRVTTLSGEPVDRAKIAEVSQTDLIAEPPATARG